MAAVGGVRQVTVGSQTIAVGDTVTVPTMHETREIQGGLAGAAGYSVRPVWGFVEVEAILTAATDLDGLAAPGQTVQVDFRSGRSYVIDDATMVGEPPTLAGDTGRVTLRYESATGPGRWL